MSIPMAQAILPSLIILMVAVAHANDHQPDPDHAHDPSHPHAQHAPDAQYEQILDKHVRTRPPHAQQQHEHILDKHVRTHPHAQHSRQLAQHEHILDKHVRTHPHDAHADSSQLAQREHILDKHIRTHPHAQHEYEHEHAHSRQLAQHDRELDKHVRTRPRDHWEHAHRRHGAGHQTCASTDQGSSHGPEPGPWKDAHATFYGAPDGTIGGACGYEESDKQIYGSETAAVSKALFDDGMTCGACFEIKCGEGSEWCKPGQPSVHVTATDFCPPGGEGWCNSPKEHFDLSQPAFHKIAEHKGGVVPIKYRRVPCKRHGGIRFKVTGNPYFNLIGITNVGGAGDVAKAEVKVGEQWTALKHNYGDRWDTNANLVGKKLTFRITTSDGKNVITEQAAPQDWQFGKTYQGKDLA